MSTSPKQLLSTLESTRQVLISLQHIIREEQRQLMSAMVDSYRLTSLSEDKQALLVTLEFLDNSRQQLSAEAQMSPPYPIDSACHKRWADISALAVEMQQANQHLCLLLNQHLDWTQQALNILTPLQNQHFYGPDGHPVTSGR